MWTVVKYKLNEINLLKDSLKSLLGEDPVYFQPKVKIQKFVNNKLKTFEKPILENYLIFYHSKVAENFFFNKLRYLRGLSKILSLSKIDQKDIKIFIDKCKKFENKDGFLLQEFFNNENFSEARFISGPFSNLIFKVVSKKKKEFNLLIGNLRASIKRKNTDCLFRSV